MIGVTERPLTATGGGRSTRRWLIVAAVVGVVVLLGWIVGFSSLLGVRSVIVRGATVVPASEIRSAASVPEGSPLFRLDTSAIERRVEALPRVRSVAVATSYPSTVTITVVERAAVGYRVDGSGVTEVDADNVGFLHMAAVPKGLPKLDDSVGLRDSAPLATVAASLSAAEARSVARITAPTDESITLTLADGRTVLWGGTDRGADKARLLSALLTEPGSYFDVSDPDTVISRGGN
jgi:cell division protein FtsQ